MAKDVNTTVYLTLTGKLYWARVYEPDTAFGSTNYKLDFVPDNEAEWKKFKDSGIQKTVKEDDANNTHDGNKYFQLVRPAYKLMNGMVVNFTGPIIEDQDGKIIVDYVSKITNKRVYSYDATKKDDVLRRGSPILLGNGSKVQVKVSVYDTQKGKGHRLDTIRVLDLIEYKSDGKLPELSNLVTGTDGPPEEVEKETTKGGKTPW